MSFRIHYRKVCGYDNIYEILVCIQINALLTSLLSLALQAPFMVFNTDL